MLFHFKQVLIASVLGLVFLLDTSVGVFRSKEINIVRTDLPGPLTELSLCKGCVDFTTTALDEMLELMISKLKFH